MGAKVQDLKGDGVCWVVTHYRGKRRCFRYGKLRKDKARAEKDAAKMNAKILDGEFEWPRPVIEPRSLACDAVLDAYLKSHRPTWGLSTFEGYRSLAKTHLKPFFDDMDLRDLKRTNVLEFIALKRKEGKSVTTIRNALRLLSGACAALVEDRELDRNPLTGMGKLLALVGGQDIKEGLHTWTSDQVGGILTLAWEHEEEVLGGLLDFLFGTGCRLGEALALQWDAVDLEARTARIVRSARNGRVGPTKTRRQRTVALSQWLAGMLRERRRVQRAGRCPGLVFPTRSGGVRNTGNVSHVWKRFRSRLRAEDIPAYRIHDARHTYASLAMEAGVNVVWLASQLGHADPSMTLRIYAHTVPGGSLKLGFATFGDGTGRRPAFTRGTHA